MPKVRRRNLPPALFAHLLDRIRSRHVSTRSLQEVADWLKSEPEVPEGRWYKRFDGMILCGEGDLVKTFLLPGHAADGEELP